jgi:hypothetical protein
MLDARHVQAPQAHHPRRRRVWVFFHVWAEVVGYECDRWRHARRIIDEAKQLGEDIGSKIPVTAPLEDATSKED